MAPSAVEPVNDITVDQVHKLKVYGEHHRETDAIGTDLESERGLKGKHAAKYPHYLPTWNPEEKYPPLEPFEHYEHGKDADTSYPNLLPKETVNVSHLTPFIGSEVKGIQLSSLTDAGKDELARFVAERKVVAFRDQDFADLPIEEALKFGSYFGRHHIHPTTGAPEGYPEIHLVHRAEGENVAEEFFEIRTSSVAWHSDVSYELQPPGTTFLYILDKPDTGGDTLYVDAAEAYRRLSPGFQKMLHGLKATHSGIEQVNSAAIRGGIKRREPVMSVHPIVRTHPGTGEKALYVNPQFTRDIVGFKKEESDAILKFLYDHMAYGADFQARIKWEGRSVVIWDNRVTQHTAIIDWKNKQRRHLARITPQAERPYETPFEE